MARAKAKLIWANVFLLALIFSYGIIYSTEARSLTLNTADPNETHQILSCKTKKPDDTTPALPSKLGYTTVAVKEEDAFRPTTPGHSPGAGN